MTELRHNVALWKLISQSTGIKETLSASGLNSSKENRFPNTESWGKG